MSNTERKTELLRVFEGVKDEKGVILPMIDDVVFLEETLTELRKLPFMSVNPRNPAQQKATPASKQYKELLQQYNNCVKILLGVLKRNGVEDESPLRAFLESRGIGND